MKNGMLVRVIATVVLIVFGLGLWISGDKVKVGWLRFYAVAVFVAIGVLWLWETVLWKLPPAQRSHRIRRNLNGTWKGRLRSQWINPETGKPPSQKTVYLVIRQSASAVSATLLTDELKSTSSLATVTTGDGSARLDYMYLGEPGSRVEHRSRMHHGSASLAITGPRATRLKGRYWTDRDSKGELDFTERHKAHAGDFEDAERLFESSK